MAAIPREWQGDHLEGKHIRGLVSNIIPITPTHVFPRSFRDPAGRRVWPKKRTLCKVFRSWYKSKSAVWESKRPGKKIPQQIFIQHLLHTRDYRKLRVSKN